MSVYKIGSTALHGVNKVGTLKPDEKGWYDVYLGALEFPNSYGATYDVNAARDILNGNNIFVRRLMQGRLFGELGHPRRAPGMSDAEYKARLIDIYEDNEAISIKEVVIDTTAKDKHGRPFIAFRGKIKPSGPHKGVIEQKLADPDMNFCTSIRSFTRDEYVNGKLKKFLGAIVTFDVVGEPGIDVADKYNAPSCESFELEMTADEVEKLVGNPAGFGLESAENRAIVTEIRRFVKQTEVHPIGQLSQSKNSLLRW